MADPDRAAAGSTERTSDRPTPPGTPRWLKLALIVVVALILVFVVLQLIVGGEHGPRRHAAPASDAMSSPWVDQILDAALL